jgi:hypothetical protein
MRRYHAEFAVIVEDDHGAAADFAAGAGGGGNGDDRRHLRRDARHPALDHRILAQRPVMRCEERHCLRQIHGRAAADGDDAVRAG